MSGPPTTRATVPGSAPEAVRQRRILVVEDDRAIADAVVRRLSTEGYRVDAVHDGLQAVRAAEQAAYDVVVLDVMLPGLSGLEVCRRVQERAPVPVLMLTARDEEADRLVGLAVGADDYLTKPFSPRELVARVAALLRRVDRARALAAAEVADAEPSAPACFGCLVVDLAGRRVVVGGQQVHLTRTEFDLVAALARRPGRVVEREVLLREVLAWDPADIARAVHSGAARTVDSHVKAVRRKIGADRVRTVHGVGFSLETPSDEEPLP